MTNLEPIPNEFQCNPAVGAVLQLNSALDYADLNQGNRHWRLEGSCVLVEPDRILTVQHVLNGSGRTAVFLPFEGLFLTKGEPELEPGSQRWRRPIDPLALVHLEESTSHVAPLGCKRIRSIYKYRGYARTIGYGSWSHPTGQQLPESLSGLQRENQIDLGPPPWRRGKNDSNPKWVHYDNLDLSFSAEVNARFLGAGDSGGPMLWTEEDRKSGRRPIDRIVGIMRESRQDQQIGSWIGDERFEWLDSLPDRGPGEGLPLETHSRLLVIESGGEHVEPFEVPKGANRARVTINATDGLVLQATLDSGEPRPDQIEILRTEKAAAGRFLCRECPDLGDQRHVTLHLATASWIPPKAKRAAVQVCLAFT